ncbi:MAG: hypothetical protein PHN92_02090 [Geobacter sp.]|nr:hypothetical protein [Geobacter sp.]
MPKTIFETLAAETTRLKPVLPAEYVALVEQAIQKHAQVVQMFVSAAERAADRV